MSNDYWFGNKQASLTREQIEASWGHGDHSGARIQFVNKAFEIFYRARRNIQSIRVCGDYELAARMESDLEDAATEGWSLFGVGDLEAAFEHLVKNGGRWTDEDTGYYYGGESKVFPHGFVKAPISAVNFMNAVDKRIQIMSNIAQQHESQTDLAVGAAETEQWTRLDQVLDTIAKLAEKVEPVLWIGELEGAPVWLSKTRKFTEAVTAINDALSFYRAGIGAGFRPGTAAPIAALRGALNYLPVLGSYYGMALDLVPRLRGWFRGVMEGRHRRLELAASGAGR